jgi:hypothetical protein
MTYLLLDKKKWREWPIADEASYVRRWKRVRYVSEGMGSDEVRKVGPKNVSIRNRIRVLLNDLL